MSPFTDTSWVLVADIGGTNARFASVTTKEGCTPPHIVLTDSTDSFIEALDAIVPQLGSAAKLKAIVLAIAAPIDGDLVQLTNAKWKIDAGIIRHRYPNTKVRLINDFAALAMGLPYFSEKDTQTLHEGRSTTVGNMAVIGPGTGLGVAGLVRRPDYGWTLLTGEGGHATFAPETEVEWEICQELQRRYGRVSIERVITGQGLLEMAQILGANVETPQEVPRKAEVQACPFCTQALGLFLHGLGRIAGDYALAVNALSGVYIAGGIVPKLPRSMLRSMVDGFQDKGRYSQRMVNTPLHLIVHPSPAFVGLERCANEYLSS